MLSKIKNSKNREDGFTLIELLIVVVIIGILAAIAIPIFLNQQKSAIAGTVKSDVRNTVSNVALALVKYPTAGTVAVVGPPAIPTLVSQVATVRTDTNTITVTGGYDNYTVLGSNVTAFGGTVPTVAEVKTGTVTGKHGYLFDSTAGKYYGLGDIK